MYNKVLVLSFALAGRLLAYPRDADVVVHVSEQIQISFRSL